MLPVAFHYTTVLAGNWTFELLNSLGDCSRSFSFVLAGRASFSSFWRYRLWLALIFGVRSLSLSAGLAEEWWSPRFLWDILGSSRDRFERAFFSFILRSFSSSLLKRLSYFSSLVGTLASGLAEPTCYGNGGLARLGRPAISWSLRVESWSEDAATWLKRNDEAASGNCEVA